MYRTQARNGTNPIHDVKLPTSEHEMEDPEGVPSMRGRTGKVYDRGVHNVTSTSLPAGKHQYRGGDNAHSGTGEPLWAFCGHEGWWGRSTARESEHVPESVAFMISDHTAWQGVHGWCTFLHSRSLRSASARSSESLSALWMQQIAIDTISIRDTGLRRGTGSIGSGQPY